MYEGNAVIIIILTTLNTNLAVKRFSHVTFSQKLEFQFLAYMTAIWTVTHFLCLIWCVESYLTTRILFPTAWCHTTIETTLFAGICLFYCVENCQFSTNMGCKICNFPRYAFYNFLEDIINIISTNTKNIKQRPF